MLRVNEEELCWVTFYTNGEVWVEDIKEHRMFNKAFDEMLKMRAPLPSCRCVYYPWDEGDG